MTIEIDDGPLICEALMPQGSGEWLEWCRDGVDGSDIFALIVHAQALGLTPPSAVAQFLSSAEIPAWTKTARQLYRSKVEEGVSRHKPADNPHIQRGKRLKPMAVAAFNQRYQLNAQPCCVVVPSMPWLRASLSAYDGTAHGGMLAGVKAPSKRWTAPPAYMVARIHYERAVATQAGLPVERIGLVCVYDGHHGVEIEPLQVPTVDGLGAFACEVATAFTERVRTGSEPPLTERDALERTDKEWRGAAKAYLEALDRYTEGKARKQESEQKLRDLVAAYPSMVQFGSGVEVERGSRKGNVDYQKALKALSGLSADDLQNRLEEYRSSDNPVCTIKDRRSVNR